MCFSEYMTNLRDNRSGSTAMMALLCPRHIPCSSNPVPALDFSKGYTCCKVELLSRQP
jgi:hypothetical protein